MTGPGECKKGSVRKLLRNLSKQAAFKKGDIVYWDPSRVKNAKLNPSQVRMLAGPCKIERMRGFIADVAAVSLIGFGTWRRTVHINQLVKSPAPGVEEGQQ